MTKVHVCIRFCLAPWTCPTLVQTSSQLTSRKSFSFG